MVMWGPYCTALDALAHHPAKAEGGAKLFLDTRSMCTALEAVAQHRSNAVVYGGR